MTMVDKFVKSIGRAVCVAVVVVCAVGAIAPSARAQGFRMGQMALQTPEKITEENLKTYQGILGLDEAQKQASQALFEAYTADREKADKQQREDFRKIREEFDDTRDSSVWTNKMPEVMAKYAKQTAELDKSFMSDLRSLLRPDQAASWTTLERTHRRVQAVPSGMLAGEAMDLVAIVNSLNIATPPAELTDTLDRYSSELDGAIQERAKVREGLGKQLGDAGRGTAGVPDFQALQKVGAEMRKAGLKVRDINDRYTRMVQSVVPTEKQADFEAKVKKARFPNVYSDSATLKSLDAALKFNDLDERQASGINAVRESYLHDVEGANDRLASAISKAEVDGGGDDAFNFPRWMSGNNTPPPDTNLTNARKARREIDRAALDKLKALLNEAQIDRLPEPDDRGPGGPRGGGGPGGRGR